MAKLITTGKTIKKDTECGSLYVVINGNPPMQMFAYLGKGSGCLACWLDSTTRLVAESLQAGLSVYKVIRSLKGNRCPTPHLFPEKDRVLSCADALGCALEEYCQMIGREDLLAKPVEVKSKVDVIIRKSAAGMMTEKQVRELGKENHEETQGKCKACGS